MWYHARMVDETQAGLKQPVRRRKRDVAVGVVVRGLMENEARKKGVAVAQVLAMWPKICPLLAAHSYPDSLKGGVLRVVVASDAVKQELLYMAPQLVASVNMLLGYKGAQKIIAATQPFSLPAKPAKVAPKVASAAGVAKAKARCKDVRDDGIRMALERLGALILDNNKE